MLHPRHIGGHGCAVVPFYCCGHHHGADYYSEPRWPGQVILQLLRFRRVPGYIHHHDSRAGLTQQRFA